MKHHYLTIALVALAFVAGVLVNPLAITAQLIPDCDGLLCTESSVITTKNLIADAGFLSTHPAHFISDLYANGGGNSVNVDASTANMQGASGQSAVVMDFGGAGVTAIGSIFENGNSTVLTVDDVQKVITISNMPTTDPHVVNALYSVGGVIHISGG